VRKRQPYPSGPPLQPIREPQPPTQSIHAPSALIPEFQYSSIHHKAYQCLSMIFCESVYMTTCTLGLLGPIALHPRVFVLTSDASELSPYACANHPPFDSFVQSDIRASDNQRGAICPQSISYIPPNANKPSTCPKQVTCHTALSAGAKPGSYTARVVTGDFGNALLQQPPRFLVSNANSFRQLSTFRYGMTHRDNLLYAGPRDAAQECRPSLFFTSSLVEYTAFLRDHTCPPWSQLSKSHSSTASCLWAVVSASWIYTFCYGRHEVM
jgi:hypothetical protein